MFKAQRRSPAETLGDFTARVGFDAVRAFQASYIGAEAAATLPKVSCAGVGWCGWLGGGGLGGWGWGGGLGGGNTPAVLACGCCWWARGGRRGCARRRAGGRRLG